MSNKLKNLVILILCVIIVGAVSLCVYTISAAGASDEPNPNVTLVTVPDQTDFEVHSDWTVPPVEEIDYGENIALGKEVTQNGSTQIYHCRNAVDGDRFTYWEGLANSYPNEVTIDMGEAMQMTGARILLNPRQIWGARTQDVEILVSEDGENFTTIQEKATLSFDPMADNSAYVPFAQTVQAQYIRFQFYSNSGATAGQAAEIEVYGAE